MSEDQKKSGIPFCGDPNCHHSTTVCSKMTFGKGRPDAFGYFKEPCAVCIETFQAKYSSVECTDKRSEIDSLTK